MNRTQHDDEHADAAPRLAVQEALALLVQRTPRDGSPGAAVVDVGCEACGARAALSPQESLAWFGVHPYGCGPGDPPR